MSDQELQALESQFPAISGSAFANARKRMLDAGEPVLQSEDGVIYKIFPDGRREAVKKIDPPRHFATGSVFNIQ
jgi:hypothetical protein